MKDVSILNQITNNEFNIKYLTIDNEPWFLGKELAIALGYKNTRDAIINHVHREDKQSVLLQSQNTTSTDKRSKSHIIVNESGLYSLILKSNLESARKFQRWVTSEVLPSIRKTGSYSVNKEEPEYLEFGSLEYPMNWIYEHSNIIDVYSRSTLKTLDFMEKEIKNMKDNIKQISRISLEFKKNSGEYRFNSRLIKYDRYKQLSFD